MSVDAFRRVWNMERVEELQWYFVFRLRMGSQAGVGWLFFFVLLGMWPTLIGIIYLSGLSGQLAELLFLLSFCLYAVLVGAVANIFRLKEGNCWLVQLDAKGVIASVHPSRSGWNHYWVLAWKRQVLLSFQPLSRQITEADVLRFLGLHWGGALKYVRDLHDPEV